MLRSLRYQLCISGLSNPGATQMTQFGSSTPLNAKKARQPASHCWKAAGCGSPADRSGGLLAPSCEQTIAPAALGAGAILDSGFGDGGNNDSSG